MISHKSVILDEWLSSVLQKETYRINLDDSFVGKRGLDLIRALQSRDTFLYAKVPVRERAMIGFLQDLRFDLIETNIRFTKNVSRQHDFFRNVLIRFADYGDCEQVIEIALRSFTYSRFHVDPHFSQEVANRIKAEWAQNYFLNRRGHSMIVAVADGIIRGFLQIVQEGSETFIIDLIAVDSEFRHKGIASDMITYAEKHYEKYRKVKVGTQLANIPSVRLYEKMGFRMEEACYVFHYYSKSLGEK